jgi:hypothetical protein
MVERLFHLDPTELQPIETVFEGTRKTKRIPPKSQIHFQGCGWKMVPRTCGTGLSTTRVPTSAGSHGILAANVTNKILTILGN